MEEVEEMGFFPYFLREKNYIIIFEVEQREEMGFFSIFFLYYNIRGGRRRGNGMDGWRRRRGRLVSNSW